MSPIRSHGLRDHRIGRPIRGAQWWPSITRLQSSFLAGLTGHSVRSLRDALAIMCTWRQRARSRRELAGMSDAELRDIRLSRCDAWAEISKPFWRA